MRPFARRLAGLIHMCMGWLERRAAAGMLPGILIACALGVGGVVHLHGRIEETTARAVRVELATASVRSLFEAAEARHALSAYFAAPDAAKRESALLKFEVLMGRLEDLRSGAHLPLLEHSSEAQKTYARAAALLGEVDHELRTLDPGQDGGRIDSQMRETTEVLQRFVSEALRFRAQLAAGDQRRLNAYSQWQLTIVAGLLVAILSAMALAILQKRRLTLAHREAKAMSEKYEYLAKHDAMTGLANRRHGKARFATLAARAGAGGHAVALLCLDIDRFKQINDTLGHGAGDALIIAFADRLKQIAPPNADTVLMRLGGDEFVVAFPLTGDAAEALEHRSAAISGHLTHVYDLEGHHVAVGASVGAACAPGETADWTALLSQADIALRHAKERGRGQVAFYQNGMFESEQRRHQLEQDLRFALARGQFELHYQPIVRLASGDVVAVEALLRWRHPSLGFVSPADFIPVAEDSGEIVAIGEWVLRTACRDAAGLPEHVTVSVNLSAVQLLRDNLVQVVAAALDGAGLPGRRLELEVTESVMIKNEQRVSRFIDEADRLGVGLALDDFGTGYSSLGYIRRFAFRRLKIDRSFVQDIERNPQARALAHCIVDIGKALDMAVTAEGVETQAQALVLAAEGCHCAQGYMFSRPLPLAALTDWLASRDEGLRDVG